MARAQEDTQDTTTSDSDTNAPPTLKELMAQNDQVTNTVGIVLVKISPGLWAGKFEVTQDAYQKLMHSNPSAFRGDDRPVDSVSWNDAMAFCGNADQKEKKAEELPDGYVYSLPTQDQWFMLMDDATLDHAVMSLNLQRHVPQPSRSAVWGRTSLGLYDTRGNVMEWCLDPQDKPYRVLRGGAWDTFIDINARIEFRDYSLRTKPKTTTGSGWCWNRQGSQ